MDAHRQPLRFGRFELDLDQRTLCRDGGRSHELTLQQIALLRRLVTRPGKVVGRAELMAYAWNGEHVSPDSLNRAISRLRGVLGPGDDGRPIIAAKKRHGFYFKVEYAGGATPQPGPLSPAKAQSVAPTDSAPGDAGIDIRALLGNDVRLLQAIRALATLQRESIARARGTLESLLAIGHDSASVHVALANALVFEFEATRAQTTPNRDLLIRADRHAQAGCRLDPDSAEAWSAAALVCHRLGRPLDAVAAARRADKIEPGTGVVHRLLRFAFVAGAGERLLAAERVIHNQPGNALARWLAGTVFIARGAMPRAIEHVVVGCDLQDRQRPRPGHPEALTAVGLHLLHAQVLAALGDELAAERALDGELTFEGCGHFLGPEACANTYYTRGALAWRRGDDDRARESFMQALRCLPDHKLALVALAALDEKGRTGGSSRAHFSGRAGQVGRVGRPGPAEMTDGPVGHDPIADAIAEAVGLAQRGRHAEAARVVRDALLASEVDGPGAAWIVPIEPILNVSAHMNEWEETLALIAQRAA